VGTPLQICPARDLKKNEYKDEANMLGIVHKHQCVKQPNNVREGVKALLGCLGEVLIVT
jgi:hypothetical protein